MNRSNMFVFVIGLAFASATLKIKDLKVPQAIENGSAKSVVLDCDFEAIGEKGLEIKWYHNNKPQYIYQWLPQQNRLPQAIGEFQNKLDVRFKASNDSSTMYRALYIKEVTPEISGFYTCKVSSFFSEVTDTKKMIVYEPAKGGLDLVHAKESATVVCSAYGLSPAPNMTLQISGINETLEAEPELEEDDGVYNITSVFNYDPETLTSPTNFVCDLTIPGTSYHLRKTEVYYPEEEVTDEPTTVTTTANSTYVFDNDDDVYQNKTEDSGSIAVETSILLLILLGSLQLLINK